MAQSRSLGDLASTLSGTSNTDISFDSGTFYIDAINNRVGFGTSTPTQIVDIVGTANVSSTLNSGTVSVSGNTTSGNVITTGTISGSTANITGKLTATSYNETLSSPAISANTLTINCSAGNLFSVNLNSNITTVSFTNVPSANSAYGLSLHLAINGSYTITWPASVKWPANTAPTLTTTVGKVDTFILNTFDGGTVWYAFTAGQDA